MKKVNSHDIQVVVQNIFTWFKAYKRTFPWRDLETSNINEKAYRILVSEIMLQQTQAPRVAVLYPQFLKQFQNMKVVSEASVADALRAWKGLGYNNRALRLREAITTIVTVYNGVFPSDMETLLSLPGVGRYTAGAIRNFAFHIPTPCIDTNIRRIVHRIFFGNEYEDGSFVVSDTELIPICQALLDSAVREYSSIFPKSSLSPCSEWHAALMDFGSLVCTKKNLLWRDDLKDTFSFPAPKLTMASHQSIQKTQKKKEPGYEIAGSFIPRRIMRGKIITILRDHPDGMNCRDLSKYITVDEEYWNDISWLEDIVERLTIDGLIEEKKGRWKLRE